jgi:hypothetical protein
MSDSLREAASATSIGGSTIAGCGAWTSRLEIAEFTSGAGTTTGVGSSTGSFKSEGELAIAATGIVGFVRPHATMLGNGTSRSSFSFGGATIVCVRLSASGGTEMIGCAACAGSPFCGFRAWAPPVSSGARYSDGS